MTLLKFVLISVDDSDVKDIHNHLHVMFKSKIVGSDK